MSRSPAAWPLWALLALVLVYEGGWFWGDNRLIAGVPVNLVYHLGVCVLTTLAMVCVVRWAWPYGLDEGDDG